MSLPEVHARLANTALFFIIAMAIWGLWRLIRKQGLSSNYWGALIIAEILIIVQGLLGGYLWLTGLRPDRSIHVLYGIVAALTIPAIYAFTKGGQERREMIIYSVALLVLVGILLRAISTALVGAG
jgi:heme A synthase